MKKKVISFLSALRDVGFVLGLVMAILKAVEEYMKQHEKPATVVSVDASLNGKPKYDELEPVEE